MKVLNTTEPRTLIWVKTINKTWVSLQYSNIHKNNLLLLLLVSVSGGKEHTKHEKTNQQLANSKGTALMLIINIISCGHILPCEPILLVK